MGVSIFSRLLPACWPAKWGVFRPSWVSGSAKAWPRQPSSENVLQICCFLIDVLGGGSRLGAEGLMISGLAGPELELELCLAGRAVGSKFNLYQVLMLITVAMVCLDFWILFCKWRFLYLRRRKAAKQMTGHAVRRMNYCQASKLPAP